MKSSLLPSARIATEVVVNPSPSRPAWVRASVRPRFEPLRLDHRALADLEGNPIIELSAYGRSALGANL